MKPHKKIKRSKLFISAPAIILPQVIVVANPESDALLTELGRSNFYGSDLLKKNLRKNPKCGRIKTLCVRKFVGRDSTIEAYFQRRDLLGYNCSRSE
jgi:hypothetical protein